MIIVDTSDSVSREMVEAGLVDGKDMIVGKYYIPGIFLNNSILCEYCNLIGWSAWSNIGYSW